MQKSIEVWTKQVYMLAVNILDFLDDRFRVSVVLYRDSNKVKGKVKVKLFQYTS
jgi:hypothetical protein